MISVRHSQWFGSLWTFALLVLVLGVGVVVVVVVVVVASSELPHTTKPMVRRKWIELSCYEPMEKVRCFHDDLRFSTGDFKHVAWFKHV